MKKRLLILSVFLLTAFTSWSQIDSTKYWVSFPQLQEMYRIMLTGDECQEENTTLLELVAFNDSLSQANTEARENLKGQLIKVTEQRDNNEVKYEAAEQKYDIAVNTYKEERRKKAGWFITAVLEAVGILILIFTG